MSAFTAAWIAWGVAFAVIEGVALANSRRGDTLSEHVWAWLGVGAYDRVARRRPHVQGEAAVAPSWTLKLARLAIATGTLWLGVHFLTGGRFW